MATMQLQMFLSELQLSCTTTKFFFYRQFAIYGKYIPVLEMICLSLLDFAHPTGKIGRKKANMLHQLESKFTHMYIALPIK